MPARLRLRVSQRLYCASMLSLCPGCGGENSAKDEIRACRARTSEQSSGIHGCITHSDDVGTPPAAAGPYCGFPVEVFLSEPPATPEATLTPFAQAESDSEGFYDLGLSPGTFWICTSFRRCTEVSIPSRTNLALDYDFGPGPGWSVR